MLPDETLIYFGDTVHLPYGDKSPEAIRAYSEKIAGFLIDQGCKMIVIACNTASSVAFEAVKKIAGEQVLVVDVINPVVQTVSSGKKIRNIGVIGTRATTKSRAYPDRIVAINPELKVASVATPLLAPMIEEGFFNNNISRTIINNYLADSKLKGIDTLILACTHYPLIKKEIKDYYKPEGINIIDSADIVAKYVKSVLKENKLLSNKLSGKHHFYISDYTKSFAKSTKLFFHDKIKLEYKNLWS